MNERPEEHQDQVSAGGLPPAPLTSQDDVQELGKRGALAMRSGDFQGAEAAYRQILQDDNQNTNALAALVRIFEHTGRPREAISALIALAQLQPDNMQWSMRAALLSLRLGQVAEAEELLLTVLRVDPGFPGAANNLAAIYRRQGRDKDAATVLITGIKARPQDGVLWLNCGAILVAAGNLTAADLALGRAIFLLEDKAEAQAQRSDILMKLGRHAEAIELLEDAVKARPDHIAYYLRLASLTETSDPARAIDSYEHVLKLDPAHQRAKTRLIVLLEKTRDHSRTAEFLSIASAEDPENVSLLLRHARALMGGNNLPAAEAELRKVLERDAHHVSAHRQLAVVLHRQGLRREAVEVFANTAMIMRRTMPASFIDGLAAIEQRLRLPGFESANRRLSKGLLPSRSNWSEQQRIQWGRLVTELVNNWVMFRPLQFAEIIRFTAGFDWIASGEGIPAGSIFVGANLGAGYASLGALARSRRAYKVVSANDELVLSQRNNAVDGRVDYSAEAMGGLIESIKSGVDLFMNGDGGVGSLAAHFDVGDLKIRLVEDPYTLGLLANRNVYICMTVFCQDKIEVIVDEQPKKQQYEPYEKWLRSCLDRFEAKYMWSLEQGAENRR